MHRTTNRNYYVFLTLATRTTNAPTTNNFKKGKVSHFVTWFKSFVCKIALSYKFSEKAEQRNYGETKWYVMLGLIISGIIIGLFLAYILLCARRRWFTNRKFEQRVKPGTTEVDTTYEELDLTKMKTEDNYQSLRVDVAIDNVTNEDDLNYTTLSQTRDVENNYQSLT